MTKELIYFCKDCGKKKILKFPSQSKKSREDYRCYTCAMKIIDTKKISERMKKDNPSWRPEVRKKKSESLKKYYLQHPEVKIAMRERMIGYCPTVKTRKKISEKTILRYLDPIERNKQSLKQKNRWEKVPISERKKHMDTLRAKITDETRQKMGISLKRRWEDPNYKERLRESARNRPPRTEETRKKLSRSLTGKPGPLKGKIFSETHRKRMSESLKKRYLNEDERKKQSERSKTFWKNPNYREKMSGENSVMWKGGVKFGAYCPKFNNPFKESVRIFNNHQCVECGTPQNGKRLNVHHVYYNKKACCNQDENGNYIQTLPSGEAIKIKGDPNKFVSLCDSCHAKTGRNRLYWAKHFEEIINEYYGGKSYLTKEEMMLLEAGEVK